MFLHELQIKYNGARAGVGAAGVKKKKKRIIFGFKNQEKLHD